MDKMFSPIAAEFRQLPTQLSEIPDVKLRVDIQRGEEPTIR